MYRVEFRFAYGGSYFSETFEDFTDVENLRADIANSDDRVRFMGIEVSDDGESWEPYMVAAY